MPPTNVWRSDSIELFLLDVSDVSDSYVGWLNDPAINAYLESRFQAHTLETTRAFVKQCRENDATLLLGIRCSWLGSRHVGNIKIEVNKQHRLGEIGILIGEKSAYGRGIGSQAIRMVSDIARDELRLRKLSAGCYSGNRGSERAFEKAGFQIEGRRPNHYMRDDHAEDLILMGLFL